MHVGLTATERNVFDLNSPTIHQNTSIQRNLFDVNMPTIHQTNSKLHTL